MTHPPAAPRGLRRRLVAPAIATAAVQVVMVLGDRMPSIDAIAYFESGRNLLDGHGYVHRLHWLRAPRQAPEVIAEIERTVRAAAPFPPPTRMGKVVYTDTWLWHKSGQFQLDTLTEGQD